MRRLLSSLAALALVSFPVALTAQSKVEADVRAVLTKQAEDWNRGDLAAFEAGYKDSPDVLFIGGSVRRGYKEMQETYAKYYGTPAARGVLRFADLEVHPLDARFAVVLGHFYLVRTAEGGGNADGIFTLVFEKTAAGWKIVIDHTNPTAPSH